MTRSKVMLATMLCAVLQLPGPALAGDKEQAVKLFMEGNALRLASKYQEALEKYNAAYKLLPSFKIEYNRALVLEAMGDQAAAYNAFRSFLKSGADKSPESMLQNARDKMAVLKQNIALLSVVSPVEGAAVKIKGTEEGKTPLPDDWMMAVRAPQKLEVWVEAAGYRPFRKNLDLRPGHEVTVQAALLPQLAATVNKPPAVTPAKKASVEHSSEVQYAEIQKRRSKTIWAWTALGIGLACAAGAGVMYGVGNSQVNSAYDEYSALTSIHTDESFDLWWADVEAAGNLYVGGHVLAGVAAAAMGVSVYMFLTRPPAEKMAAQQKNSLWLSATVEPGGAGLLLRGGF